MRKLAMLLVIGAFCALPVVGFAFSAADTGLGETASSATLSSSTSATYEASLPEFIGRYVIQPILGITATLIFALMAYAGFLWMTAQGDDKKVIKAKAILTQAVVGAIILVGSYAMANFVISSISSGTSSSASSSSSSSSSDDFEDVEFEDVPDGGDDGTFDA